MGNQTHAHNAAVPSPEDRYGEGHRPPVRVVRIPGGWRLHHYGPGGAGGHGYDDQAEAVPAGLDQVDHLMVRGSMEVTKLLLWTNLSEIKAGHSMWALRCMRPISTRATFIHSLSFESLHPKYS